MRVTLAERGSKNEIELLFLFIMGRLPRAGKQEPRPVLSPEKAVKGAVCRGLHKLDMLVAGGNSLSS